MEINVFDRVASRIEDYVDEIIEMQSRLTAAHAIGPENGGKGEFEKAEYIKNKLKILNPDELIEVNAPDERVPNGYRPNIIAIFNGKNFDNTFWIITHLDVVPPGDLKLWESNPLKVEFRDGKLYGRGVEDNQQSLISSYMTIKALKDEDVIPSRKVGLLMVSDEETGSEKGLKYVLGNRKDLFGRRDLFVVPDGGNSDGTMIEIAEKGMLWLRFQILGKQGHGSRPDLAVNSFRAGSYLVTKLDQLYKIHRLENPLYDISTSTFEPTKKEANVMNVNTIPGEDIFYMDCRILPEIKMEEVMANINVIGGEIEARFKVKVSIQVIRKAEAAIPTSVNAPVVRALMKAIKAINGRNAKPMGVSGESAASVLRRAKFPVAVWATVDETEHQPNEYCILNNLINDAKVFLHIALQRREP